MPFFKIIGRAAPNAPIGAHAWVPIDDASCMLYSWEWHPDRPLTDEELVPCLTFRSIHAETLPGSDRTVLNQRTIHAETLPGSDRTVLNQRNDYLIDRQLQRSGASYTGIRGIGMQDTAMQESMGAIQDRTEEHLATGDMLIIALRRYLLDLLSEPIDDLPALDPASHHGLTLMGTERRLSSRAFV
jgi:hypothetical protein